MTPDSQRTSGWSRHPLTDQLLTGRGWMHISWNPFGQPRHQVRIGYYK